MFWPVRRSGQAVRVTCGQMQLEHRANQLADLQPGHRLDAAGRVRAADLGETTAESALVAGDRRTDAVDRLEQVPRARSIFRLVKPLARAAARWRT